MSYAKITNDDLYNLWLVYVTGSNEPRAALKSYDEAIAWCNERGVEINRAAYSAHTRRRFA